MARQVDTGEEKVGLIVRVKQFYQEVLTEMKKVTWPTQDELKTSTSVLMLLLVVSATVIYFYDVVFQFIVIGLFKII